MLLRSIFTQFLWMDLFLLWRAQQGIHLLLLASSQQRLSSRLVQFTVVTMFMETLSEHSILPRRQGRCSEKNHRNCKYTSSIQSWQICGSVNQFMTNIVLQHTCTYPCSILELLLLCGPKKLLLVLTCHGLVNSTEPDVSIACVHLQWCKSDEKGYVAKFCTTGSISPSPNYHMDSCAASLTRTVTPDFQAHIQIQKVLERLYLIGTNAAEAAGNIKTQGVNCNCDNKPESLCKHVFLDPTISVCGPDTRFRKSPCTATGLSVSTNGDATLPQRAESHVNQIMRYTLWRAW